MLRQCPKCGVIGRVSETEAGQFITCDSCGYSYICKDAARNGTRLTLTRAQLKQPEVEEFVVLLSKIASDGILEYEEVQALAEWLNGHSHSQVPAIQFMFDLMLRISTHGKLEGEETFEIQLAIERVLPKEFRTQISEARKKAYYSQPASQQQLDVIEQITNIRRAGLTRVEASDLIQNPPASNRQIMFLRFWNRLDMASQSRHEICDWMDAFISENRARWTAWDLYKRDSHDDGTQHDPSSVPIGAGEKYLEKAYRQLS
jgi:hypothetical protein